MIMLTSALSRCLQLLLTMMFLLLQQPQTSDTSVTLTASTFNVTYACLIVQNGTFLKDPTSCNRWIECIDNEPVYGTCATGLFYNRDTRECVDSDTIKCYTSSPCAKLLENGFVADPNSCNGYYYCYNGQGIRGACSAGLNFNPGTQDCVRNFECLAEPDPDSWCNIIPDGVFFVDDESCQGYHICKNYTLETGHCPSGYYYDAHESVCNYVADVKCNLPVPHPNLPANGACQNAGQFLSDNETCSGYYYCKETSGDDFELIWGECSDGRFFDPIKGGRCVDRQQIVCDYNRCVGMGNSSIQLANAPNDGCTGFLVCQGGEEIGSGICPSNEKYYDEVTQLCTNKSVSYPACVLTKTTTTDTTTTTTTAVAPTDTKQN